MRRCSLSLADARLVTRTRLAFDPVERMSRGSDYHPRRNEGANLSATRSSFLCRSFVRTARIIRPGPMKSSTDRNTVPGHFRRMLVRFQNIASFVLRKPRRVTCGLTLVLAALGGNLGSAADDAIPAPATARLLIFRNIPSWDRNPDFEEACRSVKISFQVKPSSEMK